MQELVLILGGKDIATTGMNKTADIKIPTNDEYLSFSRNFLYEYLDYQH
ncbi:MAG: hypothetical protein ACK5MG_10700 [Bacteroidales bacterium]